MEKNSNEMKLIIYLINKTINKYFIYRAFVYFIIILLIGICLIPIYSTQSIDQDNEQSQLAVDGQILFSPMYSKTTYLMDTKTKTINQIWSSDYYPGEAVRYLGEDTILRSIKTGVTGFGGAGGGVQKVLKNGTIVWDFRFKTNHHDIIALSNGNVLMLTWETKTYAEALQAGRIPNTFFGTTFTTEHIIEVKPTGPTSGDVVWEWCAWDHLIQDFANGYDNYGVVEDHPELIDINYGINLGLSDWLHTNSIDYNEKFDQILISVHNFNEIWVIDHSTTTAEAASHSGGRSGKGGDLLYRWGNPKAYRAGNSRDQKLFSQHDATWIDEGCPGEGNILIFNNGVNRPRGPFSSVDEIVPTVDKNGMYYLEPDSSYGPKNPIWSYMGNPPSSFYSAGYSGAERLKNGNTLICEGKTGRFFEVTPDGSIVWQYINSYSDNVLKAVFKIVYIPAQQEELPNYPPNKPILNGPSEGEKGIEYTFTAKTTDPDDGTFSFLFDWGDGNSSFIQGPFSSDLSCNVSHIWTQEGNFQVKVKAIDMFNSESEWSDPIEITLPKTKTIINPILRFLQNHPNLFSLLQRFLQFIKEL
jgi:hypothetical protein